jgi:hypothetical protein
MNTYPTTAEQLYIEQQARDDINPGCIEYRKEREMREKFCPKTEQQKLLEEEGNKKFREDQILGYASRRYDFPEYQWWMIQDGKKYLRSSCSFNVYDYVQPSVIVGTWNEQTQRIEFTNDLIKKVQDLEETVFKLTARLEQLISA